VIPASEPSPGGDQRAAGGAKPGRVGLPAAEQQAGDHASVEAVAASGRVHHVDRGGGYVQQPAVGVSDQAPVRAQRDRLPAGTEREDIADSVGDV
jgi:hypothetical protein